jgi:hypothetical protein
MTFKIGDIVSFNDGEGEEGVGIIYESGNKDLFHQNYRVQDATGTKHKGLTTGDLSDASPAEVKQFEEEAGAELTKEAVIAREAGESGLTVEEYLAWVNEGIIPEKWKKKEAEAAEGEEGEGDGGVLEDEGEEEDD